ncbi:hypothetical protein Pelo_18464 [Pelomyxa schiedti]|nr:hypothetical protein Pelo_18464 [Pelomyxa schiedti]
MRRYWHSDEREAGMVDHDGITKSDTAELRSQPAFSRILPALKRTFPALAACILQQDYVLTNAGMLDMQNRSSEIIQSYVALLPLYLFISVRISLYDIEIFDIAMGLQNPLDYVTPSEISLVMELLCHTVSTLGKGALGTQYYHGQDLSMLHLIVSWPTGKKRLKLLNLAAGLGEPISYLFWSFEALGQEGKFVIGPPETRLHAPSQDAQPERSGHQARIYEPTFISSGGTRIFCMKRKFENGTIQEAPGSMGNAKTPARKPRQGSHNLFLFTKHGNCSEFYASAQALNTAMRNSIYTLMEIALPGKANAQLSSNAARQTLFNSAESSKHIIGNTKAMAPNGIR